LKTVPGKTVPGKTVPGKTVPKQADDEPDQTPRLVLVGMMGSGKTTVGRLVASRLGVQFADTDEVIEASSSHSVKELFGIRGEAAFRREESAALATLLAPGGPGVIAAGGGAVLDEVNRALMRREATVAWLRTTVGTLTDRVGTGEGRPLLTGAVPDRLARIAEERGDLYEGVADLVVDTDDRTPEAVADAVVAAFVGGPVERS
jgi:shikimate kinase